MTKRVLVTGATGFLGRAVVRRLEADGNEVTPVTRSAGIDLMDGGATREALTPWRWDAVVHLAGPAPKADLDWSGTVATIRTHVTAATHITRAIPAAWDGRFIHVSAMLVYGLPVSELVAETHPLAPLHPYALAKLLAEDIVLGSSIRDRWSLRMGGLFSEERRSGALFHFMRAAREGRRLRVVIPDPPVPWEILHVDDAAEAIARALASPSRDPGPVNIGYGEPIRIEAIAHAIAARVEPAAGVEVEGGAAPMFHADVSKARSLFDWPPRTLGARLDALWEAFA